MRGFACDECGEGEDVRDIEDQANSSLPPALVGPNWLLRPMPGPTLCTGMVAVVLPRSDPPSN